MSRIFSDEDYSPLKEDEPRKFKLDRDKKPNCKLPKEIKDFTVRKTAGTKGKNEWIIEVVGLEKTYINCFPGKVDQVYTSKIAEGCGIGKFRCFFV